jgi:hypothetical protein
MITLDDLKTNRDTQITVACIAFFLVAFPLYFSMQGGNASGSGAMGGVADYNVNGELTYVQIADGIEYIADGDTLMIDDLHTDSVDGAEDMNIVGVRVTMSYGEDETTDPSLPAGCVGPAGGQNADDTITGSATHLNFTESNDGQNGGQNSGHEVAVEWFNSSMVGATVSELTESEIVNQIDSMGAGLGIYSIEIGVVAESGNAPGPACSRSDAGEEVTYSVELIIFDYTIAPAFDEAEL